ncbi:MAG: ABC transporter ATP-binding protein, partial [Planctomycetaceae bacterium]
AEVRAVRWQTVIDSFYGNVWQLAIVGVLLAGGAMSLRGDVSLGEIITFDVYVLMLVWPMFDVGQFLVRGKLSGVAITRIDELERFEPDVRLGNDDAKLPTRRPRDAAPADHPAPPVPRPSLSVDFDGVSYRYADADADALFDVSFAAQSGRLTAIVGAVGSGKSTALALVPRLMEPTRGRIVIGERELTSWDPVALRGLIGYVPQEAALLSGTVEENIRFGREWITDDDLSMAIETARLGEAIDIWPQGLQTVVGSRGLRLSGGQKQRVALARALAGRPSVLLLDDCTSALDAETEEAVWQHLLREIPGCTTLLVTHRTATLRRADRIIVLDRGRALEAGDFPHLNRRGTQFHRLYRQWRFQEDVEE